MIDYYDIKSISKFYSKIIKTETCWLWRGNIAKSGYGLIRIKGKLFSAHRYSYFLNNKNSNEKLWVMHSCDVRQCVNPEHLSLGTPQDNIRDMFLKNRRYIKPDKDWVTSQKFGNKEFCKNNHKLNIPGALKIDKKTKVQQCLQCVRDRARIYRMKNRDKINYNQRIKRKLKRDNKLLSKD